MKAQVLKLEQELDKSKALTVSMRDERDSWRRKVGVCFALGDNTLKNDDHPE